MYYLGGQVKSQERISALVPYPSMSPLINMNTHREPEQLQTHLPTLQNLIASGRWTAHLSTLRTTYAEPYVVQPLASLLTSSMPDLVSVLLLILILFLTLKVLDYARRIIVFWVVLVVKVVFWAVVLGGSYWVYQVGIERALANLGWFWGALQGFVEGGENRTRGKDWDWKTV